MNEMYETILLALCVWREARNQSTDAKRAVAWSIKNRVLNPTWWGTDWVSVILKPFQYSSFNRNDPNAVKLPILTDNSWQACMEIAQEVHNGGTDTTNGATHYFDKSLDNNPPTWVNEMVHTCDIGDFHFYKVK